MRFWDASAVIPLCIAEPLSALMRTTAEEDESLVAWWGTPIECWSAFARMRREGELDSEDEGQAHRVLASLMGEWSEIHAGAEVRDNAARALRLHPLRAADALQLAAALCWARGRPSGHAFVCLDRRLRDAARNEGFLVLPESADFR